MQSDSMETGDDLEKRLEVDVTPLGEGRSYLLSGMDSAGLLGKSQSQIRVFLREGNIDALRILEGNTVLQGPPGSGKSTLVWFWLLRTVAIRNEIGVWYHFSKSDLDTCVIVRPTTDDRAVALQEILKENPFDYIGEHCSANLKHCVVDGVRQENLSQAKHGWKVFGRVSSQRRHLRHMIFVSSQQVIIPGEELEASETTESDFLSWSIHDVLAFANTMTEADKNAFRRGTESLLSEQFHRDTATSFASFEDVVKAKYWIFGGSARWMFGISWRTAWRDLQNYSHAVDDAKKLNNGLNGVRSQVAVNHVIAQYSPGVFEPISKYFIGVLTKRVGVKAIIVMYNSEWVRANPSVHGFVFEWDIFTQVQTQNFLEVYDMNQQKTRWYVDTTVSLHDFVATGVTTARMMVQPEKWNYPEYDGLYVVRDEQQRNHLIAWNASEAVSHSGNINKLAVLLQQLAMKDESPISFSTVRFMFLVPKKNLAKFELPSPTVTLQAKQVLSCGDWGFERFEVLGANPSK